MKKIFLTVSVCALLVACNEAEPKQTAQNMQAHGNYDLSKEHEEATIINKEIADNDKYKIVLISNRYGPRAGSMAKGEHKTRFYMENKTDQDVFFKVHDLVIDGEVNDDYEIGNYFKPGEDGTVQLSAFDYDGDLPPMEDSLSFTIKAYHPGNGEPFGSHEVAIEF